MTVNTKTVTGRRDVHYDNLAALLDEAERLKDADVETIGNWTLGTIYGHLAKPMHYCIDGFPFKPNAFVRLMVRLLMKKKFLTKPLPAGFQIPKANRDDFIPDSDETAVGLAELRKAIERMQADSNRIMHPILGKLTNEEWEQFQCRHAELHMSFVVPK